MMCRFCLVIVTYIDANNKLEGKQQKKKKNEYKEGKRLNIRKLQLVAKNEQSSDRKNQVV